MPFGISILDAVAFAWFLLAWIGYARLMQRDVAKRSTVNHRMPEIRRLWMERMLDRENRIIDAQLIGHTISSVTFFASTSVFVIAGLLGLFGAVDAADAVIGQIRFAARTGKEFLELKLLLMIVIFAYAFLKFTWALRQYNYCCALIGAAPLAPVPPDERRALAGILAEGLTAGIAAFNGGLRAYYFSLAVLAWFIQPWLFMVATAAVLLLLAWRQTASPFSATVNRYLTALGKSRVNS